jgi:hypothetical protein
MPKRINFAKDYQKDSYKIKKLMEINLKPHSKNICTLKYVKFKNFKNSKNFPKLIQNLKTSKVFYHM